MRRWVMWILGLGLAVWALWPLLGLTYLADDFALFMVIRSRIEQGELSLATFFAERWSESYTVYRPLTMLSLAIDDAVFARNPVGPHLANVLLHLYTAAAAGLLAATLVPRFRRRGALAASALFLFYPFHTESLSWLAARGDVLATALTVTALLLYRRARSVTVSPPTRRSLLVSTGLVLAGALCSKESAIGVTLLPALLDVVTGRAPRWNEWRLWIVRYGPFVLLSVLFVLARAAVIGELVGSYGGVSPYHPDRLRELAASLPVTIRDLLLHDSPHSTPVAWLRAARYTAWISIAVLLIAGLSVRRRALRPPSLFALGWILLVVGPFLPLYAVNLGLAGGRMFYGPAAAGAIFAARLMSGAAETPLRRRITAAALVALVAVYGLTFRQVMVNYTRATETILSVHEQMTRIRDEQPPATAFGVLDPPTIEDRAPVFGAFLQQSFTRYFRPLDPIVVRTDLSAQPLPFLLSKGLAIQLPLCVVRWNRDTEVMERISALVPPAAETGPWIVTGFEDWQRSAGRWSSPPLRLAARSHGTVRLEVTSDRRVAAELRVHTVEGDAFNPAPVVPLQLEAGRQSLHRILGPPDLWPLAGHITGLELRWEEPAEVTIDALALLPTAPALPIVAQARRPDGRLAVEVAAAPDQARYRLTCILRRRRVVRTWERGELPGSTDPEGRALVGVLLPSRPELLALDPSTGGNTIFWYVEALPAEGDVALARTQVLPR